LPQCGITRVDVESKFPLPSLSPLIKTAVQVLSRFFLQNFSKPLLKNLPQCVVKFNHETFLGCFLTFPVFSVLTTCFWSLAHLVGLSDTFDHLVGRHFLKLRSVRLNLQLFQLIPDGGSISLISGLFSNFSVRGKIAPVWYNRINGETYGQIKGLFHIFSNPGLFSYCYSGSLIPELRYYHRFGRFCRRCPFAWMM
jgi:hypothetical protein